VSRVRENRMHGSTWRREETGTSRASTSRTEPGASRRPDRGRCGFETLASRIEQILGGFARAAQKASARVRVRHEVDTQLAECGEISASRSRVHSEYSVCSALIGCTAWARRTRSIDAR
jgi:hypothetical protein